MYGDRRKLAKLESHRKAFAGFYFVLAFLSAVLAIVAPEQISLGFCWLILGIVGVILIAMVNWKLLESPVNWVTSEVVFTGSFVVVHFLYMFIWCSRIYDTGDPIWTFRYANCPHVVCTTMAMCASCLASFHFGYHLISIKAATQNDSYANLVNKGSMKDWQKLGKLMTRISLVLLFVFAAILGSNFLGGNYAGTNKFGFLPNIIFQVFQGMIAASIAIVFISRAKLGKRKRSIVILDTLLVVVGALALLLHGDRSTFLVILVALVAAYSEFVKPIRMSTGVLAAIGLFIVFGISTLARQAGERSISSFVDAGSKSSISEQFELSAKQFGSSVLCAFVAVDHVPERHPYYFGQLKSNDAAGLLPFGRKIFGIVQSPDTSSSMLFTLLIQGKTRNVSGTGSSVFGDIYLEAGFFPTLLMFMFFGILFKSITEKSRSTNNLAWKVAYVSLIAVLSISGRYGILSLLIRQVLYPALFTIFFAFIIGVRTTRRIQKPSIGSIHSSNQFHPHNPTNPKSL